jgi:nucleotide-binding universal stress UspA family protein
MYKKILVALENSAADSSLLPQVGELARRLGSELLLVHVADGWVARNFSRLKLAESEEMKTDRAYLERIAGDFRPQGLTVFTYLAMGDPPAEIVRTAKDQGCDLIAMASHGHRLLADIVFGSTINEVRHRTAIPVLVVRAEKR